MIKNYTEGMNELRALGFLYVDEKYDQAAGLFKTGAIGHCGHTGQSFFLDPVTGFYTIILSDATVGTERKYGREEYQKYAICARIFMLQSSGISQRTFKIFSASENEK